MVTIPDEYLACRDWMHAWDAYSATVGRNKSARRREIRETLLCTRCGTYKHRLMTTTGQLLRNTYTYPDGYLLKDQGPFTPADREYIRTRHLERAFTLTEESAS